MNDIRRTILWVIFGFSTVLLWDQWQLHNGREAMFFPVPQRSAAPAASPAAPATPPATVNPAQPAATDASIPAPAATPAAAGAVPPSASAAKPSAEPTATLKSDVLRLGFDAEGAALVRAELLRHVDGDKPIALLDVSKERVYVAQSGLIGGAGPLPTHKTPMSVAPGERELKDGATEVSIRFESAEVGGVRLVKTYTLQRGRHDIAVRHEIVNTGANPVAPQLYLQLVRDGNKPAGESAFYSTFTGPAVYTNAKKFEKIEFSDIEKNRSEHVKQSSDGYVAIVQHYFASAWLLADGVARDIFTRKVDTNLYAAGLIQPVEAIAPGQSRVLDAKLFVGPQEEKTLENLYPGLELVKDYGWLTILAKPLYWLLDKLNSLLGNWGWAIVGLVVLLKIAFYWLNASAYRSMGKMKAINPRVMALRERLKDKPQQMQQEMMKLYKEEKVNPMGGCFPILVQIPVFIALYWVLLSSVEIRNAPWTLWIRDLASPDPYFILPLVMTATTLLQTWLNPTPPDPLQAKLMWYLPLIFSIMFFFFPAGLVLYWITNNVLSIAQQWMINKQLGVIGK